MLKKLTEKEMRTLKMGAIGIVAILILLVAMEGYDSWKMKRDEFAELNNQLNIINIKIQYFDRKDRFVVLYRSAQGRV